LVIFLEEAEVFEFPLLTISVVFREEPQELRNKPSSTSRRILFIVRK
jgi:hypothetical protein